MLIHQPQRSEDKEVEQYLNKSLKLRENLARHRTARLQRAAATRQRRCPHLIRSPSAQLPYLPLISAQVRPGGGLDEHGRYEQPPKA